MALVYATNTLTWNDSSDQWELSMEVDSSQKGVSDFPFVVERFISEEDLLNNNGGVKSLAEITTEITDSSKYLFRRVSTLKDLLTYSTEEELAAELRTKQLGRREDSSVYNGADFPLDLGAGGTHTFENYSYADPSTADEHYDHIPVAGYYTYRVDTMSASYSTYDLASAIQEANDAYLRSYAGDFLDDTSAEFIPLSVGVAGVYPQRTFTPGSLQASDLVAGDSIYLSVSGGSGDYTASISNPALLEELSATKRYRVVSNSNQTVTITITDANTSESKDVALTIVQKGS